MLNDFDKKQQYIDDTVDQFIKSVIDDLNRKQKSLEHNLIYEAFRYLYELAFQGDENAKSLMSDFKIISPSAFYSIEKDFKGGNFYDKTGL